MKIRSSLLAALSGAALLLLSHSIHAQESELSAEPAWSLSPGDRDYLTSPALSTGYAEQGMAYNESTGHLYIVHLLGTDFSINILDGATGDHIGELSSEGIAGGTRILRKIGVTDDGVIFAGNVTSNAANDPYKLYRWTDEQADPELIWAGDPSNGVAGVVRGYGGNIAVRGGGDSTQILVAPDYWEQTAQPHVVALFTTSDGGNTLAPTFIETEPTTRFGLGTAFGEGEIFWGSRSGQPLREFDFQGNLLREFGSAVVTAALSPIGIDSEKGILAGVANKQLWLYNLASLDPEDYNTPLATRAFPTNNANIEATGEIAFSDTLVFALDTNNGVVAYEWGPPAPPEPVAPGDIYWTNAGAIRTAEIDGSNPRTVVSGVVRPIGIDIDPVAGHIYWAEDGNSVAEAGKIMRAKIDGTEVTEILTQRTTPQFLQFNPENLRLYWAEFSTGLYSSKLDGSDVRHLVDIAGGATTGVSLDLTNDYVYLGSAGGQLYRYEIGGAYPVTPASLTSLQADTYGITVDAESGLLWATTFSGTYAYSKNLATFAEGNQVWGLTQPLGITLSEDKSQLIWVERGNGRIRSANTGESTFQTLAEGEDSPFGITVRPSAPAGETFSSWMATFDLNAGQTGTIDDPDGDGISNLLEFALNLDPSAANRSALPESTIIADGGNEYLVLEVNKNAQANGVELVVESSPDLTDWFSGDDHTVVLEENASLLRVRDAVPLSDSTRRFLRLRAVQP